MKKLILIFAFVVIGFAASAQTTYTFNTFDPLEITAPDNTNTHIVQLPKTGYKIYLLFSNTGDKVVVTRWY